jgi:hypothetical protein
MKASGDCNSAPKHSPTAIFGALIKATRLVPASHLPGTPMPEAVNAWIALIYNGPSDRISLSLCGFVSLLPDACSFIWFPSPEPSAGTSRAPRRHLVVRQASDGPFARRLNSVVVLQPGTGSALRSMRLVAAVSHRHDGHLELLAAVPLFTSVKDRGYD